MCIPSKRIIELKEKGVANLLIYLYYFKCCAYVLGTQRERERERRMIGKEAAGHSSSQLAWPRPPMICPLI